VVYFQAVPVAQPKQIGFGGGSVQPDAMRMIPALVYAHGGQ